MGLTFSTPNYDKIINLIEPPYLNDISRVNNNLFEAINIDNDNRKLVYKHKTKDIYVFYTGGICNVSQCFEVRENLLLGRGIQFSSFHELKDYILAQYPKSEIILELVKYESEHHISIMDNLEKGVLLKEVSIPIYFSDDESDTEDDTEDDIENDIDVSLQYIQKPESLNNFENFSEVFAKNYNFEPLNNIDLHIFDEEWNIDWVYNNNLNSNYWNIDTIWENSLNIISDKAVQIAKDAAKDSEKIATEINEYINNYEYKYLEIIEEDLPSSEWSDEWEDVWSGDDIILPNLNYLKSADP